MSHSLKTKKRKIPGPHLHQHEANYSIHGTQLNTKKGKYLDLTFTSLKLTTQSMSHNLKTKKKKENTWTSLHQHDANYSIHDTQLKQKKRKIPRPHFHQHEANYSIHDTQLKHKKRKYLDLTFTSMKPTTQSMTHSLKTKKKKKIPGPHLHQHEANYSIHDTQLKHKKKEKYLDLTFTSTLSWNAHMDNNTKKANNTTASLCRNLSSFSKSIKNNCYRQ